MDKCLNTNDISERLERVDLDGDWPVCVICHTIFGSSNFSKLSFTLFEWICAVGKNP